MWPEAAAGTAMAANMYRVGGEYPERKTLGLGSGRLSVRRRGVAASGVVRAVAPTGTGTESYGSVAATQSLLERLACSRNGVLSPATRLPPGLEVGSAWKGPE